MGMYKYYILKYDVQVETGVSRHSKYPDVGESDAFHFLAELGLFGLVFFFWFGILLAREVWRFWDLKPDEPHRIRPEIRIGLITGIITILAHSLIDSNFHNPSIAVECFWFLGMLWGGKDPKTRKITIPPGKRFYLYLIVLSLGLGTAALRPYWASQEADRASAAIKRGDTDQGIKYAEKAVKIMWGESSYHYSLASFYYIVYLQKGDFEWFKKTIKELQESIQLNPMNDRYYERLGYITMTPAMEKKNSELLNISIQSYQKSIELRPFYPFSCRNLGRLFLDLGDLDQAESYVRKSIAIEPKYIMAHYLLGLILEKKGQPDLAVSEYKKARELWTRHKDYRPKNDYEKELMVVDIEKVNEKLISVQGKDQGQ
jgi:tetratricopeptide (TPR) repeat protein